MSVITRVDAVPTWTTLPESADELIARTKALRPQVSELGVVVDTDGTDPAEALQLLSDAGLQAINVPVEFGGLWEGGQFAMWDRSVESCLEVFAGDGSTGQCWATTGLQARDIFGSTLPVSTKEIVANELLREARRIVASNAETGGKGPVTGVRVDGGIVVSGVKTFNTNSGGGGRDFACVGILMEDENGVPAHYHALLRLDSPGVKLHGNWDNMGQRGTISQTITYADVFVADGWFFQDEPADLLVLNRIISGHAMLLQGIGEGAYDAMIDYLRTLNRPSMPMFPTAVDDVLIQRQVGELSSMISASRAYLMQACHALSSADESTDLQALFVEMLKVKVACTNAALEVSSRVHDLTGARSTSNVYRLDRFWRNARTFASHDSIDAKNALAGAYELAGVLPDAALYVPALARS